jgi:hypothetical protein
MAACDSSGKKACVLLWYQARGMRSQAVRGVAWERPVFGNIMLAFFLVMRLFFGRIYTYGLRGCCRRRRVRVFGPGVEGLRFRIGCARRRMSRRGWCGRVCGLPLWKAVWWKSLVGLEIGRRGFKACLWWRVALDCRGEARECSGASVEIMRR